MAKKSFVMGMLAAGLAFMSLTGCATRAINTEGKIILSIGDVVPPPTSGDSPIADGSYVCSRAGMLESPGILSMIFGGGRIIYKDKGYMQLNSKSVAIRINGGKVTEIMAFKQATVGSADASARPAEYYSVTNPVLISSSADLDKVSDFNEAKSMIH
jgi:hypothetical protein